MNRAPLTEQHTLWLALALSLGAAVSLGVTRFAYGLLLPTMRTDLGWSYTLAGAMNTANALGYLLGALATPRLMQWLGPARLLLGGALLASVFMVLSGFFVDATPLLVQRLLAGVASAFVFIAGGLLAARLAAAPAQRLFAGAVLRWHRVWHCVVGAAGAGGAGGCVCTTPWMGLGVVGAGRAWIGTAVLSAPACAGASECPRRPTPRRQGKEPSPRHFAWRDFSYSLAGYGLFGVGYIGYMTFVIALLREQGASASAITLFYALLGVAVVLSSRIWAGLLDRFKGGQALAILNGLLGVATVLPALTSAWPVVLASGLLFGGVFLSVVASTTALVRHNLPQSAWATGISAFTVVFAAGQIVGPTIVGLIADGPGGLSRGLVFSAGALWVGAALAWRQRPL
ncbi:MAG: YbfB/YjiJ family MFS transporter [Rhodoferax sp.]|nr:YbfB/YjiJ family MFS transporter [Rhodoferax sp.]